MEDQWNWFLTPSSTPTDATFSPPSLQTPRTSTHFNDAFSPYINQENSNTPHASSFESHSQSFGQENTQPSFDNQTHNHHGMQQYNALYPAFDMNTQINPAQKPHHQDASVHSFADSFQVQTPPPTRDQPRRKSRTQSVVFGTPSALHTRQQSTGQSQLQNQQPSHQPRLQMSASQPVLTQFNGFNTATAPVTIPQDNNTFWGTAGPVMTGQQTPSWNTLDDPFNFQPHAATLSTLAPPIRRPHAHPQPTLPSNDRPQSRHAPTLSSTSMQGLQQVTQPQSFPNMMTSGAGVNPTLLYSSPNRFMSNNFDMNFSPESQSTVSGSPDKQPHVQFAPPNISRPNSRQQNLVMQEPTARPAIRRSNTTGASRPQSMYASLDALSRSNSTANIARRPSPLKRNNRNSMVSLAAIAETPNKPLPRSRTSVVLTVDSKGRARAETRVVDVVEDSPSKSMKSRYPSLWDDSDSESDSDRSSSHPSMNNSFSASRTSERHTKIARLDPPLENLEGLHIPRSNSSASIRATPSKAAYAASIQLRRQGSAKKNNHPLSHSRHNTVSSFSQSHTDLSTLENTNRNAEMALNDAGAALRMAMEGRSQQSVDPRQSARTRAQSSASRPAFPPRTSSLMGSQSSFTLDSAPMIIESAHNSPTKNNPVKPTGDLADAMNTITRCVCHFPFTDNQLMIQCNSCHMWLHAGCLGMNAAQLPPHYICTFCSTNSFAYATPHTHAHAHAHAHNPAQTAGRVGWETAIV